MKPFLSMNVVVVIFVFLFFRRCTTAASCGGAAFDGDKCLEMGDASRLFALSVARRSTSDDDVSEPSSSFVPATARSKATSASISSAGISSTTAASSLSSESLATTFRSFFRFFLPGAASFFGDSYTSGSAAAEAATGLSASLRLVLLPFVANIDSTDAIPGPLAFLVVVVEEDAEEEEDDDDDDDDAESVAADREVEAVAVAAAKKDAMPFLLTFLPPFRSAARLFASASAACDADSEAELLSMDMAWSASRFCRSNDVSTRLPDAARIADCRNCSAVPVA
mmetsp:Transcript_2051/g.6512  ORF Transcript_2051/g.6512 Transcript_2051/m.6512 type:complete len:282 (+) Transcript_2051:467-1312(+)